MSSGSPQALEKSAWSPIGTLRLHNAPTGLHSNRKVVLMSKPATKRRRREIKRRHKRKMAKLAAKRKARKERADRMAATALRHSEGASMEPKDNITEQALSAEGLDNSEAAETHEPEVEAVATDEPTIDEPTDETPSQAEPLSTEAPISEPTDDSL